MLARECEIVAVDFESTGVVRGYEEEPWQLGMAVLTSQKIGKTYDTLLKVGERPFSEYAPGRWVELREQIRQASSLSELWPEIKPWWLGKVMAAHHAGVEQKFIAKAVPMHRIGPWVDTLKLARKAYPNMLSHRLEDLLNELHLTDEVLAVCPGKFPHDALFDAVGCAVLLKHLLSLKDWEDLSIEVLCD